MPTNNGSPQDVEPAHTNDGSAALLLRAAAGLLGMTSLAFVVWLVVKAFEHPDVRASQLGNVAPWWVPFIVFIVATVALMIYVFLRAAHRLDNGEDLFACRHRRHPSDPAPDTAS